MMTISSDALQDCCWCQQRWGGSKKLGIEFLMWYTCLQFLHVILPFTIWVSMRRVWSSLSIAWSSSKIGLRFSGLFGGRLSFPKSLATALKASQSSLSIMCAMKSALYSCADSIISQSENIKGKEFADVSQLFTAHFTKLVVMIFIRINNCLRRLDICDGFHQKACILSKSSQCEHLHIAQREIMDGIISCGKLWVTPWRSWFWILWLQRWGLCGQE